MKKKNFFLRNVAAIAACLAVTVMFSGCDPEDDPVNTDNPNPPVGELTELTSPITQNTTLKDLGLPIDYVFKGGTLEVKNDAVLTIEPGVTIQFTKAEGKIRIIDGATIKALGLPKLLDAQGNVVVVGGVELDGHIQFIGTGTEKGSWSGIQIATTTANVLNYVEILNAGGDGNITSAALYVENGKVAVTNCLINNSKKNGITLENKFAELTTFTGNTISNCDAPIYTYHYMGCYGLRNLSSNDNPFDAWTGNVNPYIHIISANTNILGNMTLHALKGYPWYFQDGLRIDEDRDVTVEAGAVILIGANTGLFIPATSHLIAEGTAAARITIKGKNDIAGYWKGIEVRSTTPGTKFVYCDISGGGAGSNNGSNLMSYASVNSSSYVALDNTAFSKSLHYGLYLDSAYGSSSSMGHVVIQSSNPSSVTFSQCPDGNIWSNCTGQNLVYTTLSQHCDLQ